MTRARRASPFFRPYRRWAAVVALMTLFVAAINAVEPVVFKWIFDALTRAEGRGVLVRGIVYLAAVGLVREVLTAISTWLTWKTRLGVHQSLLDETVGRLHRLPLGFWRGEGVGAIMTRLDRGIQGVVEAASQLAFNVFPAIVYLAIAVVLMWSLEPRLAIVVIVLAPVPALLGARATHVQTQREKTLLERWMRIYSRFNEVLTGIVTVKSFTREEEEKRRFMSEVVDANRLVIQGVRYDATVGISQNLVVTGARVLAFLIGGILALEGRITVGTLVAFLGYIAAVFGPVQGLTGIYRTLRTGSVGLDTITSILDTEDLLADAPDAVEAPPLAGGVTFEAVRFSYEPGREILKGVDLHVRPGERLALVGPSGSGKSTLMSLLQRFYDPTGGRILVDGLDVRTLKQRSLRAQIGVVLQESLLFDDTLRANIAYGRPNAALGEIEEAARAAHAHEFILRMPEGYETRAGERGSRLSGGERQRVAIARALLKRPPILVLDEATSALDAESEALVQEALERLVAGRTTFVIAHRLATVVNADRVAVLRDGILVEIGSHAQLVAERGYYASLVARQTRGLLPDLPEHRRRAADRAEAAAAS